MRCSAGGTGTQVTYVTCQGSLRLRVPLLSEDQAQLQSHEMCRNRIQQEQLHLSDTCLRSCGKRGHSIAPLLCCASFQTLHTANEVSLSTTSLGNTQRVLCDVCGVETVESQREKKVNIILLSVVSLKIRASL